MDQDDQARKNNEGGGGLNTDVQSFREVDPTADAPEFRRCLSQFATGVTVVTAVLADRMVGMTANSFASLSLDPPLILWSLAKSSSRFSFFDAVETFAVNVLSDRQTSSSRHFATAGEAKFDAAAWTPGLNGAPILEGTAAFFECQRAGEYDGGDHRILIGRVTRAARFDRTPLLFSQGVYRIPADHPDDRIQRDAARQGFEAEATAESILSDLFRANHKIAAAFVKFRGSLTRDEHRILISVERRPGLPVSEVAEYSFLGANAAEDACDGLLLKKLLIKNAQGGLDLTEAGRDRRRALVGHLNELERKLFMGIPAETVRAARKLLRQLASD